MSALHIFTERLDLIAATLELARADTSDRARFTTLLDARLPEEWPPPLNDDDSARWLVQALEKGSSADSGWLLWYFVLRENGARVAIGNGGFKGEPVDGTAEIGYSIVPNYHRRGLGSEAVSALVDWAFSQSRVTRVIAETLPELEASQGLLRKLGFCATEESSEPGIVRFELHREAV